MSLVFISRFKCRTIIDIRPSNSIDQLLNLIAAGCLDDFNK